MRDAEGFARQAVEEVAGDRFTRGKADRMNEAIEFRPHLTQLRKQPFDLRVVGDIAVVQHRGAEVGRQRGGALLEALADVAERQFGTLAVAGPRDAIGDRAVRQHAGDQQTLAGQKSHDVFQAVKGGGFWHAGGRA